MSRKFSFHFEIFQPASQSPFIFPKSQILARKSQSLNKGEKTLPSEDPACNLQDFLDDSFFRARVH